MEKFTKEQLKEWKDKYKHVYRTIINDNEFIWHKLNRTDYKTSITESKEEELEIDRMMLRRELFCKKCIVYPEKEEFEFIIEEEAGLVESLCDIIMTKSGFDFPSTTEL